MQGTEKDLAKNERIRDTEAAVVAYQRSDAFVDDLMAAFTAASQQAQQENKTI